MIRQIRGRERGMSFWPFIIALVFLLIAVYAWYGASQREAQQRSRADQAEPAARAAETLRGEYRNRLEEIQGVLGEATRDASDAGKAGEDHYATAASISLANKAQIEKWREKMTLEFDADKYTGSGNVERIAGNKVRVYYLPAGTEIAAMSPQDLFANLETAFARMQADLKRAFEESAAAKADVAAKETAYRTSLAEKDRAATEIRTAAAADKQAAEARERELTGQIEALKTANQAVTAEQEAKKTEHEVAMAKSATELNQTKAELQNAMRKDAPYMSEGADGSVLNTGAGLVIIDLGKKHMLKPGTVFTVLGHVKGGQLVPKGTIKVNVSREDTADAIILEEDPKNPITMGDAVASKLFSKERKLHLVLLGEFRKMGRSQAEGKLKSLGVVIDPMVSAATDYVVVGTPSAGGEALEDTDTYKRAKDYHIQFLNEDELAAMTNY